MSRIVYLPFPEIEKSYIVFSPVKTEKGNKVAMNFSFLYADKDFAAEWAPDYGPITLIEKCNESHCSAEPHWFFPFCTGYGNWFQEAVYKERLPEALLLGNYVHVFKVLKKYHTNYAEHF